MAVAFKTSQGTPSAGSPVAPAIVSLVGVLFLLACLAIVFKLIPDLWWTAWDSLGMEGYTFVGGAILLIIVVGVSITLFTLGVRLLGGQPQQGVRAGVVVGFLGLVLALLLARWASLWLEHWAFVSRRFNPSTGMIAAAVMAGVFFIAWLWLLFRPKTHEQMVRLEQGGWFSTAAYKANQGQRVRRATILGILLLVGAGIYTMVSHQVLSRGSPNWTINLPFTGKVAIDSFGDAREFLTALPPADKSEVQIVAAGDSSFRVGQPVSFAAYRTAVEEALNGKDDKEVSEFRAALASAGSDPDPTAYLLALSKNIFGPKMKALMESRAFGEGSTRRLESQFAQTEWEGIGELIPAFRVEATAAKKDKDLGWELNVPAAVLLIDRYTLRDINDKTDGTQNVKVVLKGDSKFTEGALVSLRDFNAEVDRLEELKKQGRDRVLPESGSLISAGGKTNFASFTLLPSVQFTVPLLLLAASIWLAWRIVNMPTFADFLIATEAELNKVSWTTQRRLIQDTIVVIATVVLMAVFLFGMDYTWKIVLSWKPIGVLHIPKDTSQQNKSVDQKRW